MTAILIYGRLDKAKSQYQNIKYIFGNVDFFASSDNSPQECVDDFLTLYKPILYTNEPIVHSYQVHHYPNRPPETNDKTLYNMIRHFINKKRVFELMKQSGKTYKCIISLRVDVVISCSPSITILPYYIYIPYGNDHRDGINDQIALGNESVMKPYMNIIDSMVFLLESGLSFPHPERLTLVNLQYHNVPIKRFNLRYDIIR